MSMRHSGIIKPVNIPRQWKDSVAIELLYEKSRWYFESGSESNFRHWVCEISEAKIETIPLQWVPEYVGVSRAAVLKRAKAGGLTVFSFIFTEYSKNLLGRTKTRDSKKQYDVVPLDECNQWRNIILEIA